MNKYLLLRDNKQSGPYSVSELAAHGLKAYDLVWLEGKSAAWRYPSEIEELKPFAPAVEEQPFDRFYKKPDSKSSDTSRQSLRKETYTPKTEETKKTEASSLSSQSSQISVSNGTKKIHVSLPGGIKPVETASAKPVVQEQKPVFTPPVAEKSKPVSQNLFNEQPVVGHQKKADDIQDRGNFEETYRKSKQKKQAPSGPPSKEAPVSTLLFRSVAAACLLLGGALIGLIINYNSQQQKFQQLNQLVEEIKQQDNPGSSKVAKNENLSTKTLPANSEPQGSPALVEQPVYKEDIQLPSRKEKNQKQAKTVDTISQSIITPEVTPEVSKNEEAALRMTKLASETAKKNLWQLVTVNHNNYKTGVFGGISNLSLKLSNRSLFQLQQVEVEVLFLSPEKKTVNKQKIIFENVAPGEQLSIDIPKSNRGVKIDYTITKISTKEFELAHAGM